MWQFIMWTCIAVFIVSMSWLVLSTYHTVQLIREHRKRDRSA